MFKKLCLNVVCLVVFLLIVGLLKMVGMYIVYRMNLLKLIYNVLFSSLIFFARVASFANGAIFFVYMVDLFVLFFVYIFCLIDVG